METLNFPEWRDPNKIQNVKIYLTIAELVKLSLNTRQIESATIHKPPSTDFRGIIKRSPSALTNLSLIYHI
jgi:hypothetical protein